MARLRREYRAKFQSPFNVEPSSFGPPREQRFQAERDRPTRSEETYERNVGVQSRVVGDWEDA